MQVSALSVLRCTAVAKRTDASPILLFHCPMGASDVGSVERMPTLQPSRIGELLFGDRQEKEPGSPCRGSKKAKKKETTHDKTAEKIRRNVNEMQKKCRRNAAEMQKKCIKGCHARLKSLIGPCQTE